MANYRGGWEAVEADVGKIARGAKCIELMTLSRMGEEMGEVLGCVRSRGSCRRVESV